MSPDQTTVTLIAFLASLPFLIRAISKAIEVIAGNASLVQSLAAKYDSLLERQHASEIAQVRREGELMAQISVLQATVHSKDESLAILQRMEPQVNIGVANSSLANQQLTTLQHTVAVNAQPGDTAAADAAHTVNVQKDYNATQGNAPVVMPQQEVPRPSSDDPDPPPMPVLVVNSVTGEAEKRLVS